MMTKSCYLCEYELEVISWKGLSSTMLSPEVDGAPGGGGMTSQGLLVERAPVAPPPPYIPC